MKKNKRRIIKSGVSKNSISHAKNEKNNILKVKIVDIIDNPYQPRIEIKNDSLNDLANSIKENGLLQPILLNKLDNNNYELIAGHRRTEAHKILGLEDIKAIVISEIDKNDVEYKRNMSVNALIENIQRENLNILEVAISIKNLIEEDIFSSKQDIAKYLGKSNTFVSKMFSVLNLQKEIISDLRVNKSLKDLETLYELQKIKDDKIQLEFYYKLIEGVLTRKDIREYNKDKKELTKTNPEPYKIDNKKDIMTVNISTLKLDDLKKKELEDKILLLLKEYV